MPNSPSPPRGMICTFASAMELVPSIRLLHPSEPARRGPREFGSLRASSEAEALSAQMLVRNCRLWEKEIHWSEDTEYQPPPASVSRLRGTRGELPLSSPSNSSNRCRKQRGNNPSWHRPSGRRVPLRERRCCGISRSALDCG